MESVCAGNRTGGSNPLASANKGRIMKKKLFSLIIFIASAFQLLSITNVFAAENPAVNFIEPTVDTTIVSINDSIPLKIGVTPGDATTSYLVRWSCENPSRLSSGYTCPADNTEEASIAYKTTGTYRITATVTDNNDRSSNATILINVVSDLPTITASTSNNSNEFPVNSNVAINIAASDQYGIITKLEWGCANGTTPVFNSEYVVPVLQKDVNHEIEMGLPGVATENYICLFRAFDDDGGISNAFPLVLKTFVLPSAQDTTEIAAPDTGAMTKSKDYANTEIIPVVVVATILVASFGGVAVYTSRKNK